MIPASMKRRRGGLALGVLVLLAVLFLPRPAGAQEDWKARWDRTVATAEKEGALDVSGPSGRLWQQALSEFSKAYPKIKIRVTPFASRDFWPRALKEREVGKYLWDIRVGGGDTQVYTLIKEGGLADIRAMLILPEVAEEANWHGGFAHMFLDDARKYLPSFGAYVTPVAHTNRAVVRDDEVRDFAALLDPRFKGRISMADPRGGSTAVIMAVLHKKLGPQFIRDLFQKQQPVIFRNTRQLIDTFASGKYPIAFGLPAAQLVAYKKQGGKLDMGMVRGIDVWAPGVAALQALNPRPHPNATVVFVNWLLSREAQSAVMTMVKVNSRRKDVPVIDAETALDWSRVAHTVSGQTEDHNQPMVDAKLLIRELVQ